jgi:hypothetical protein
MEDPTVTYYDFTGLEDTLFTCEEVKTIVAHVAKQAHEAGKNEVHERVRPIVQKFLNTCISNTTE